MFYYIIIKNVEFVYIDNIYVYVLIINRVLIDVKIYDWYWFWYL